MSCENIYCIYNKQNRCGFESVTINALGMCEDCILVSFDKDFLDTEKKRQLQNIERRWENNADSEGDICLQIIPVN